MWEAILLSSAELGANPNAVSGVLGITVQPPDVPSILVSVVHLASTRRWADGTVNPNAGTIPVQAL
jgi:hypothetical protein